MVPRFDFSTLPKCGAHARSNGKPCKRPSMANGRCYIHGGRAKIKHGRYTKQAKAARQRGRKYIKDLRASQRSVEMFVS